MPAIGKWVTPAEDLTPARKHGRKLAGGAYAFRI
jgi:hypothetical protein